jgi:zinc-binding alcohol dehydrogenase family protein
MQAIGAFQYQPATAPNCFSEIEVDLLVPNPRDLVVRVKAVSVNPVDYKVRKSLTEKLSEPRILGWDAAGTVEQVGSDVTLFQPGDQVYYAGSLIRPGSNSEYQLVDERIVGRKPTRLSFEEAAALPLTTLTAWEALFEQFGIVPEKTAQNQASTVLIIGGAGGVGSIAIQLAKQIAGLQVIATASRPESVEWCLKLGADACINHHENLTAELQKLDLTEVDYILCFNNTDLHWAAMAEMIKPHGKICSIVETRQPLDLNLLQRKSATFTWELMFTKSIYETANMQTQHDLLNRVGELIDQGVLQGTMTESLGSLNAATLAQAHARLESGQMVGKLVISGIE